MKFLLLLIVGLLFRTTQVTPSQTAKASLPMVSNTLVGNGEVASHTWLYISSARISLQ